MTAPARLPAPPCPNGCPGGTVWRFGQVRCDGCGWSTSGSPAAGPRGLPDPHDRSLPDGAVRWHRGRRWVLVAVHDPDYPDMRRWRRARWPARLSRRHAR